MPDLLVTGGAGFIGANFVLYWRRSHPRDRLYQPSD
jgi:dTDP-glucose 4,6-dehydratase